MRYVSLSFFLIISFIQTNGQKTLPVGSEPPALEFSHFPNRAYAVIWRNWNLVPAERLAEVLGCSESNVINAGISMGLPAFQEVPPGYDQQMYITILRRNWHLLPYDQLLVLLNMSAEDLDIALDRKSTRLNSSHVAIP